MIDRFIDLIDYACCLHISIDHGATCVKATKLEVKKPRAEATDAEAKPRDREPSCLQAAAGGTRDKLKLVDRCID